MSEVTVKKVEPEISDREQWLDARRSGIGGSDAAAVLNLSPWKSAYALWCEKTGLLEREDISDKEFVEWGNILEEPIARKYCLVTGRTLIDHGRFAIRHHPEREWMLCTIDREISPVDDRGPGDLSIKNTNEFALDDWDEVGGPIHYQVQLQHELAVIGWQWASFAVLIGGNKFRWCDVERNDAFIAHLIEHEEEFMERIKSGDPPPPDGSASATEALRRLYPRDTGETVKLPDESLTWHERLVENKAAIKSAQAEIDEYSNLLRAAIGDATFGVLPDGKSYSWKWQARAAYSVPAGEMRVLRRLKK